MSVALEPAPARGRAPRPRRGRGRAGWLVPASFLAPSLLHFVVFTGGTLLASLVMSTWKWDLVTPHVGVGLGNYTALFQDPAFWRSLLTTLLYCAVTIPLSLGLGLVLALALDSRLRAVKVFRFFYFLPYIAPLAAVAILWRWMYNSDFGIINYVLSLLLPGEVQVDWLGDPATMLLSIGVMDVWKGLGWSVTLFAAGLLAIPQHFYEAAELDGASAWQRFRFVTWPMLSPTTFFLTVVGVINSFQVFDSVYLMLGDNPNAAGVTYNFYVFQQGFRYFNMGYAAALSWVLFAIIGTLTFLQFRYVNKRVTYELD